MRNEKGQFVKGIYNGFGFKKGNKPWNTGMKGLKINTGRTHFKKGKQANWITSEKRAEICRKISEAKTGKKRPDMIGNKYGKGITPWNKGKEGLQIAWNKGQPAPWAKNNKWRQGIPAWNKGKEHLKEENNPAWKGNNVGYSALHYWVKRHLGIPKFCEHCKVEGEYLFYWKQEKLEKRWSIQWANKSQQYFRDLSDWLRLCVPCHKKYDSNLNRSRRNEASSDGNQGELG